MNKLTSRSPLTNVTFEFNPDQRDKDNIDFFLAEHPGKKVVVVQGLGFVGAVMSLVVANALTEEYAVIGVDILSENTYWKIKSINSGNFPISSSDPKIDVFYKRTREKHNLYATFDTYAYEKADIIIVDINLDVNKRSSELNDLLGFDIDIEPFKRAILSIGVNCKHDCLVLVETTVPPGTCQKIVQPIIESCLRTRKLPLDKIKIGHSYERVMPGPNYVDSIQNFYRVYSGVDDKSKAATEQFLRTVISTDEYPLTLLDSTNATEMAKVLENSYRAMNIGFIVEWSRFAEEAGVNLYEVVNAIRMRPTHKNMMLPGIGVGGYCLTKDPLLASWAKQNLFGSETGLTYSENGVRTNDKMPYYAFKFLKEHYKQGLRGTRVLLLGVSYLSDVGDTRYTPVETFYNCLNLEGAHVFLHDPYVSFWEEKQLRVSNELFEALNSHYDVVVISTGHSVYKNNKALINIICNMGRHTLLLDTIGVFSRDELNAMAKHLQVKVLGRGDL